MKNTVTVLAGAAALAAATFAAAQSYPNKSIRVIVPYAAGGGTDIIARAVATEMSAALGEQMVIDNRGGGAGMTGTAVVGSSPPDGYTLLVTSGAPISVNISLFSKVPYDPVRNFAPISLLSTYSSFLVVHPSIPARSVKELIALSKTRPGQLTFASGGFGTTQHLSGEMLKAMAGIDIVHIPYKGGGQAIIDLLGGHVSMFFGSGGSVLQYVRTGKARLLAVTSAKRSPQVPDVPTVGETLPGFESQAWVGMFAPANTPRDVIARLNAEAGKALQNPNVRNALAAQDYVVVGGTPEEFAEFIRKDTALWAGVIKKTGIKAD
jgi:tripartite-type tricarboxylate transporter receptor subunit TctC